MPGVELTPVAVIKIGKLSPANVSSLVLKSRTDAEGIATFDWFPRDVSGNTNVFLVPGAAIPCRRGPEWRWKSRMRW